MNYICNLIKTMPPNQDNVKLEFILIGGNVAQSKSAMKKESGTSSYSQSGKPIISAVINMPVAEAV